MLLCSYHDESRDHCPEERRLFQLIYGLSAEKLQEFRYATHPSILRSLNTVGYAHLSGKIALREEKQQAGDNIRPGRGAGGKWRD
ncbi:hypothetical protein N7466_008496 [Penicillium verhagenii]|uniref:uncharacterized protein n=1 Tax=Penicillium verhagenii TaxID=1562060 RepID=UPI002545B84F|nr:uncharacterized protein N7466_008496 [Penicillium verhagenii]KAJ5924309.1 hypothetical protein N7466_008496 [Penicillium verhagenii]